jgi:hypothetical protein
VAEKNPPQPMDAAGEGFLYDGFMVAILSDIGSFQNIAALKFFSRA